MSVTLRLPGKSYWDTRRIYSLAGLSGLAPYLASLCIAAQAQASEDLPPPRGQEAFEESKRSLADKPMQWTAGFHPVIWNDNYKLGLGLSTGLRMQVHSALEAGSELHYTRFRPQIRGFTAKNEIGARVFALHALHLPTPFTLKLGAFAGWNRFSNEDEAHNHLSLGGEAQAAFDFVSPWGLYLQFSPGYAFGDQGGGIFRLGIGATYNVGGRLGRQPKAKLQPPDREQSKSGDAANDAFDFGGTMVPLPEPDHDDSGAGNESGSGDPVLKDLPR